MKITLYHHPRCSKSRKTLELIRDRGIEPRIVEYLSEPPAAATTVHLARLLDLPVSALVRVDDAEFKAAADQPDLNDAQALALWLEQHPAALQRPIVVDEDSARAVIGRPPENVLSLLDP